MVGLLELEPKKKGLIFDLAEQAGMDMSDWVQSASDQAKVKENPKYCYEWAFEQKNGCIMLNIWHADIQDREGTLVWAGNQKKEYLQLSSAKETIKATRAKKMDAAIKSAYEGDIPVKIVLLKAKMKARSKTPIGPYDNVGFRELDSESWRVRSYNKLSGDFELARGIVGARFLDQFSVTTDDVPPATKIQVTSSAFQRSAHVRTRALRRANGRCEFCNIEGFRTVTGSVYLETHHVTPLSEGGADSLNNVIVLCSEHHRRAHFGEERDHLKNEFRRVVAIGR